MRDNDQPAGLYCPGCDEFAAYLISPSQAFCGNDNCRILMWDPAKTINELAPTMGVVDLTGLGGDRDA